MSKDRAGQSVGTLSPKKYEDLVTVSGTLRREVWRNTGRVRSRKAAKNRVSYHLSV